MKQIPTPEEGDQQQVTERPLDMPDLPDLDGEGRIGEDSVSPFTDEEIRSFFIPHKTIECVLGNEDRLMKTVDEGLGLSKIIAMLFLASVVFAIPYGAAPPARGLWKIAVLYTGSMMICLPSLFVFGQYLRLRLSLAETLVVSLLITSVSAMFTLGFFPIIWFIDYTTGPGEGDATVTGLSFTLLVISFVLGIAHMIRSLKASGRFVETSVPATISVWLFLLAFITYRMASVVGVISW